MTRTARTPRTVRKYEVEIKFRTIQMNSML